MAVDIRHRMVALLPRLRAFAHALARSGDAADDLVQATCEKALRAADTWTPGTRLDSWMFRIMQNQWIDEKRRQRPQTSIDEPGAGLQIAGEDGAKTAEARLTLGSVRSLIGEMPEELRSVLVLVCVEDMSYRDAAEVLDVPVGTVMSRLARARRTLIEAVDGEEHRPTRATGAPS
ncbi:MAG: RNA polymerase sigma factor [Xanthobacteraceae bacterium]